jgi:acetylornithine deacetylase/succinyl-diaminopimelate desuccinylase-like protein
MNEPNGVVKEALRHVERHFEEHKRTLVELSRIPSVSANGFPPEEVRRSAEATAEALSRAGIEHVQVLELPGVHPYVYGDWLRRPGAPTILIYGHHDVQPPGRPPKWTSAAFEPTERNGRLYGRGTADDKGGVMAHVGAVAAYLEGTGSLPCNVKFLVEGEEEIGSQHLGAFLAKYKKLMAAQFVVLSDTGNFDTGVPGLTYQLRGVCQVDVEVQCLAQPVHSGGWGGPVPDAVRILCGLIADLQAADGSINVPGLYRRVAKPSRKQLERIRRLPFDESAYKREAGMVRGATLGGERRYSVYERLWTRPALTVIALEARPFLGSSNQIIEAARARLSLRTVPKMDGREAGRLIVKKLTSRPPQGAKVTARVTGTTPWWSTNPEGPAFEAARRALQAGFGVEAAMIGCGGTIGFVQPFADLLGGAPCLLTGVADPVCNAHSENESLHLEDWAKSMRSAVHLYDELSRVRSSR